MAINFHRICSVMKIYIICCVLAQILCWEKSCFWDTGQNALSQSDCRIFKSIISPEQVDEIAWFLHVDANSQKLKASWKYFGWAGSEMGVGNLVSGLYKFTVPREWTDGRTDFLHAGTNSCKLKGDWEFLGWAWSKMCVSSLVMGL